MYCVDVLRPNVTPAFQLLGEAIKCPMVEEEEVEEMKKVIEFQLVDVAPQVWLGEGLQLAGYGRLNRNSSDDASPDEYDGDELQQLGRPHFCK